MLKNAEKNVRVTSYVKGQAPSIKAHTFILPHFFPYLDQNHATNQMDSQIQINVNWKLGFFTVMVTDPGLNAPTSLEAPPPHQLDHHPEMRISVIINPDIFFH